MKSLIDAGAICAAAHRVHNDIKRTASLDQQNHLSASTQHLLMLRFSLTITLSPKATTNAEPTINTTET